jgi:hypothetical protein
MSYHREYEEVLEGLPLDSKRHRAILRLDTYAADFNVSSHTGHGSGRRCITGT